MRKRTEWGETVNPNTNKRKNTSVTLSKEKHIGTTATRLDQKGVYKRDQGRIGKEYLGGVCHLYQGGEEKVHQGGEDDVYQGGCHQLYQAGENQVSQGKMDQVYQGKVDQVYQGDGQQAFTAPATSPLERRHTARSHLGRLSGKYEVGFGGKAACTTVSKLGSQAVL